MSYSAFSGFDNLGSGSLADAYAASQSTHGALIFDRETGRVVDIDPRFPPTAEAPRAGRPKLGVVPREVTLLPRHWDWLATQPGGASAALRKLVDEARQSGGTRQQKRAAQEAAYHFMLAMAGDLPGYEEATRALFADDRSRLEQCIADWPQDVRSHVLRLAFGPPAHPSSLRAK